jgi:hypothetical protein
LWFWFVHFAGGDTERGVCEREVGVGLLLEALLLTVC